MAYQSQLASIIPGFSSLTADSSNLIKQLMSGSLTGGERRAIYNAGAERGTAGGMPGSTGYAGSLFANNDLRNIGLESGKRQQQGFQDLLAMLSGYSGTVAPTTGQEMQQQQFNSQMQRSYLNDAWNRYRQEQQDREDVRRFNLKEGIGRPYNYDRSGLATDRLGNPAGYSQFFDWRQNARPITYS